MSQFLLNWKLHIERTMNKVLYHSYYDNTKRECKKSGTKQEIFEGFWVWAQFECSNTQTIQRDFQLSKLMYKIFRFPFSIITTVKLILQGPRMLKNIFRVNIFSVSCTWKERVVLHFDYSSSEKSCINGMEWTHQAISDVPSSQNVYIRLIKSLLGWKCCTTVFFFI